MTKSEGFVYETSGIIRTLNWVIWDAARHKTQIGWLRQIVATCPPSMTTDAHGLSTRELRVLELMANGRTAAQIADELRVSPAAVQCDLERVYAELGVADRASAVAHALQAGLIS